MSAKLELAKSDGQLLMNLLQATHKSATNRVTCGIMLAPQHCNKSSCQCFKTPKARDCQTPRGLPF